MTSFATQERIVPTSSSASAASVTMRGRYLTCASAQLGQRGEEELLQRDRLWAREHPVGDGVDAVDDVPQRVEDDAVAARVALCGVAAGVLPQVPAAPRRVDAERADAGLDPVDDAAHPAARPE